MSRVLELYPNDAPFGVSDWTHPGDTIDASSEGQAESAGRAAVRGRVLGAADRLLSNPEFDAPSAPVFGDEHADHTVDVFRRLFAMCIPPRGARTITGAYRQMVAVAFVASPQVFEGLSTAEVAGMLGITRAEFAALCQRTALMMNARADTGGVRGRTRVPAMPPANCKKSGSFPGRGAE